MVIEDLVDDPCGHPVAEPEQVGADRTALVDLLGRTGRDVVRGPLPSCQVAVACDGRLLAARTFGAAPTSRYVTYSCTKALVAGAVWKVIGDGLVTRDTRVGDVIDGFGSNGKESVTVEMLLTHTAGFPDAPMSDEDWTTPARRRERFASWHTRWEPGSRFAYHGTSAHWVLAQILESVTGRDFREYTRTEVAEPSGVPGLQLGTPPEHQTDVLEVVAVGERPGRDAVAADDTSRGLDISAVGGPEAGLLRHNDPEVRRVGQPGGGAIGRAADLCLFYQALLADPAGIWDPAVLAAGTAEVLCDLPDPMTGVPAHRSLGLVIAGDDGHAFMRGFGDSTSGAAFGHMGAGGQVAWADPVSGLSFAYLTNGLDRDPLHMGARSHALSSRAARCRPASAIDD